MRITTIAFLVLAAAPAFSSFEFEPVAPTDQSYVVLQVHEVWGNLCAPGNPQVSRTGNRIEVVWTVSHALGCLSRLNFWSDDVALGLLEPGVYEVVLKAERTLATRTLVVTDATPSLLIEPHILSSFGLTEVRIDAPGECLSDGAVVTVDGTAAPSRVDGCALLATLQAHEPGAANVTVRVGTKELTTVAAVRYIDPNATPDRALFERVLIPVLFNGPGAFGSQWATEVELLNRTARPLVWLPRVSESLPAVAYNATESLESAGNHLAGLVLFLPRGYDVRFGAVFRDLSREASQWGTELPIVREGEFEPTVVLLNVPFDSRYRLQLRVYGIEGFTFGARVSASQEGELLTKDLAVQGACTVRDEPCNSNQPAYGSMDLGGTFPLLAGRVQLTVSAAPFDFTRRIWAFVTVTNNVTQQVTTITPQ